tara:strand:- start:936 stop:2123 length:1188 start_codon:yes stop_codon:yes gene_type:complete
MGNTNQNTNDLKIKKYSSVYNQNLDLVVNKAFEFIIDTTKIGGSNTQYGFTASSTPVNFTVDWGDGTSDVITTYNDPLLTHDYIATGGAGVYNIKITGLLPSPRFYGTYDDKLMEITNWGNIGVTSMVTTFRNCTNLVVSATDGSGWKPTSMILAFSNCTSLVSGVSNIDVSNCTNFFATFRSSSSFNEDLTSWNVSNGTDFQGFFRDCTSLTLFPINWSVKGICSDFFYECTSANPDLSTWNFEGVTSYNYMFKDTSYNRPITNFSSASLYDISRMMRGTPFNQNVDSLTSSVMTRIQDWCRSGSGFNQSLGAWNLENVISLGYISNGSMSNANYQDTLVGWLGWSGGAPTRTVASGLSVNAYSSKYEIGGDSEAARNYLISTLGWTITDGGGI